MTKIEAFLKKIQDESVSVSSLLRETKLLASELEQLDFLAWLNLELEGYKKDNKYPEYRSVSGQMKAWNPFHGWVPVIHKTSEIEKLLCTRNVKQSVREIEELLSSKDSSYEMPYPASVANTILEDNSKTKVSLFISRSALVGILDAVRNRLSDWAIELKQNGILGDKVEFTSEEKKEAQKLKSKFNIGKIENFHGNLGENNNYDGKILTSAESFWSKVFWYIIVALSVVVIGNILSALILKYIFGI